MIKCICLMGTFNNPQILNILGKNMVSNMPVTMHVTLWFFTLGLGQSKVEIQWKSFKRKGQWTNQESMMWFLVYSSYMKAEFWWNSEEEISNILHSQHLNSMFVLWGCCDLCENLLCESSRAIYICPCCVLIACFSYRQVVGAQFPKLVNN